MDERPARPTDVAYVGRLPRPDDRGDMIAIGGIHAIGSLGAATRLRRHLAELHEDTDGKRFSMILGSTHDGLTITSTEVECPARTY